MYASNPKCTSNSEGLESSPVNYKGSRCIKQTGFTLTQEQHFQREWSLKNPSAFPILYSQGVSRGNKPQSNIAEHIVQAVMLSRGLPESTVTEQRSFRKHIYNSFEQSQWEGGKCADCFHWVLLSGIMCWLAYEFAQWAMLTMPGPAIAHSWTEKESWNNNNGIFKKNRN